MKNIIITEDFNEGVKIGKELFKEKSNIYTEKLVNSLMATVEKNMPSATTAEKEEMFYHSVYDYWAYGVVIGEEFYFNFYKLTDKEKREYVTTREKVLYVNHLNKKDDAYILNNKYETYKKFSNLFRRDVVLISNNDDFEVFCEFVDKHPTFVVKPLDLGLGIGVHKMTVNKDDDKRTAFNSILSEGRSYTEEAHREEGTAIVLEELINQAAELSCIHPASVNGIRCTTVRVDGKVHIYHPWIKMGVNGDFTTSAFMGSIDAGINAETGVIDTIGIGEFGQRMQYHPYSNIEIKGFQIPRWSELVDMATELSMALPTIAYTGWDFALTDNGWCVMEGNYTGDFLWQLLYEKGMKAEFEELIGWKLNKKFWWE